MHRHYRSPWRVLQVAMEKDRLLANPCDRVRPPKITTREMTVLSWPKAIGLADVHSGRYRTLIYLAVDSGMRRSELVGLARPEAHQRRTRHRGGSAPQGDPGPHGPQLHHRHPRLLRPPLPRTRRSHRQRVRASPPQRSPAVAHRSRDATDVPRTSREPSAETTLGVGGRSVCVIAPAHQRHIGDTLRMSAPHA